MRIERQIADVAAPFLDVDEEIVISFSIEKKMVRIMEVAQFFSIERFPEADFKEERRLRTMYTRLSRALQAEGIKTVGELLERRWNEIVAIPGIGRWCLEQLRRVLAMEGLRLKGD